MRTVDITLKRKEVERMALWRRNALNYKSRFKDNVEVPLDETTSITIHQSEEPDSTLWDASVVLSRYLCTLDSSLLAKKRVIELGAGCGLVGIIAAMQGADTVITDMQEYIPLIQQNIDANQQYVVRNNGSAVATTLDWGNLEEIQTKFNPPVDYILGSDIVYALQGFEDLVAAIKCLSSKDTQILIAYEHRWKDVEGYFLELVEKYFTVSKIPFEDTNPLFQVPAVQILKLQKKIPNNTAAYLVFNQSECA